MTSSARAPRIASPWRRYPSIIVDDLMPGRVHVCFDKLGNLSHHLWGGPRVHGELLKLGIVVSQATVGRYMPWRPKVPSPTWRSFLRPLRCHPTTVAGLTSTMACKACGQSR
jgi:hypothetical protein